MRKKLVLGTILMLSLLIVTVFAAVSPTIAVHKDNSIKNYGNAAAVSFSLPPPGVGSPPFGVPAHPSNIRIVAWDFDRRSEIGAFDFLFISVWVQSINTYLPIASVFDIPVPAYWKTMWNNTGPANPLWYETTAGVSSGHSNSFQVADNELEVWTESSQKCYGNGPWSFNDDMLMVNLTKSVFINFTSSIPGVGNQSFTLPPTTLRFAEIGKGWPQEEVSTSTGWTWTIKETRTPAWVAVSIPSWIRNGEIETSGHLKLRGSHTFTPPTA